MKKAPKSKVCKRNEDEDNAIPISRRMRMYVWCVCEKLPKQWKNGGMDVMQYDDALNM